MTFQIITDLATLDELWRAGVLYVSYSHPGSPHKWFLDAQGPRPVSTYVAGWKLLDCGTWESVHRTGLRNEYEYKIHNTWAVQVED